MSSDLFKMLSTKYSLEIFGLIYVKTEFDVKKPTKVDMS